MVRPELPPVGPRADCRDPVLAAVDEQAAGLPGPGHRIYHLAVVPAGVETQVHTHMCYVELGDILDALADMDVDVVSLEAACSDVHSPRIPDRDELTELVATAVSTPGADRFWINPDCGLTTRSYEEVEAVLRNLVTATRNLHDRLEVNGATRAAGRLPD